MNVSFPYGKEFLKIDLPDERLKGVIVSNLHHYTPKDTPDALVAEALRNPVGTKPLSELAKGKNNIVLIASDHTRPVPSKTIVPPMLAEIRTPTLRFSFRPAVIAFRRKKSSSRNSAKRSLKMKKSSCTTATILRS